jgi:hypothetical protein
MHDDIVTRLRSFDVGRGSTHYEGCWKRHMVCALLRAADEIEELRDAGDALATRLRWWTDDTDESYPDHQALRTWEEIRRG